MTAPGWYPDGHGNTRYWNGQGWTEQTGPVAPGGVPPAYQPQGQQPRKTKKWPWIVGGIAVLVVIVAVAASQKKNTTTPTAQATVGPPGTSVTASAGAAAGASILVSVDNTTGSITVSNFKKTIPDGLANISGTFYTVQITAVGKTGQFDINPLYFNARSASGLVIDISLASTADQIATTSLSPGDKVTGTIGFDVPAGESIELIQMKTVLGRVLGSWRVA